MFVEEDIKREAKQTFYRRKHLCETNPLKFGQGVRTLALELIFAMRRELLYFSLVYAPLTWDDYIFVESGKFTLKYLTQLVIDEYYDNRLEIIYGSCRVFDNPVTVAEFYKNSKYFKVSFYIGFKPF